jgi:hypothetical protein
VTQREQEKPSNGLSLSLLSRAKTILAFNGGIASIFLSLPDEKSRISGISIECLFYYENEHLSRRSVCAVSLLTYIIIQMRRRDWSKFM